MRRSELSPHHDDSVWYMAALEADFEALQEAIDNEEYDRKHRKAE